VWSHSVAAVARLARLQGWPLLQQSRLRQLRAKHFQALIKHGLLLLLLMMGCTAAAAAASCRGFDGAICKLCCAVELSVLLCSWLRWRQECILQARDQDYKTDAKARQQPQQTEDCTSKKCCST
jgi:hypothetical protein